MSHLLCQVLQSIPSSSVSDDTMKDTLPMVLNRLQRYDGSRRQEHASAAMMGEISILLGRSY